MHLWPRLAIVLAVLLSTTSAIPNEADPATDAFEATDLEFRSLYARGRAATLAQLGPVIVVDKDQLILLRDGRRDAATAIPPLYHRLKAVSHVPLAIYVALAPFGEAPLDEERTTALKVFRTRVAAMSEALEASGFNAEQIARSRALLQRCTDFLDRVLATGTYAPADLRTLTRAAAPIVLANAADAAKAQIDGYQARIAAWRREVPAEEWGRLHVLILGVQMPRKHNVAVQYFAKLLGLPGESRRLVYAEESSGEQQGLNLLATHTLDSRLSEDFFGDPDRMEIDLLGNAASVYLDGLDLGH